MQHYVLTAAAVLALSTLSCTSFGGGSPLPPADPPGSRLVKCGVILPLGKYGEWDDGMIESPAIWYDTNRGMYGMVYTGYGSTDSAKRGYRHVSGPRIGLAWSSDLMNWKKDPKSPILSGSGVPGSTDAAGVTGPFMWFERGTYHLFYFGVTGKGYEKGTKTMNIASGTDLYALRRHEDNPIIAPAGSGWRRDAIWHPNIVKHADAYYLFFNASGTANGMDEEFIGYAVSRDLVHWDVDDANSPLVVGSGTPGAWDASGRAGDPSVYKVGPIWYMAWYSWDKKHSSDGLSWTTEREFPLGWRPFERNPVLTIGAPGSFDALHAGKPFIVTTPDRHYHFYTAVALDETRQIAVAVWPPLR